MISALFIGTLAVIFKPSPRNINYQFTFGLAWFAGALGLILLLFTFHSIADQYQQALETGTDPGIWPQLITISSGVILLFIAWKVWNTASNQTSNRSFWLRVLYTLPAGSLPLKPH